MRLSPTTSTEQVVGPAATLQASYARCYVQSTSINDTGQSNKGGISPPPKAPDTSVRYNTSIPRNASGVHRDPTGPTE
ncbi:uncharacterized protein IUM83_03724 [Phytophthora cinnamomi]|uniref:uncharacterized protein n=1 Tax=Phytophthora cinnamomi TaxID=4785 RepID=UPI003559860A|nr:hypothetical protein IUM83_03724 [Phytophthora cinnamomi]